LFRKYSIEYKLLKEKKGKSAKEPTTDDMLPYLSIPAKRSLEVPLKAKKKHAS